MKFHPSDYLCLCVCVCVQYTPVLQNLTGIRSVSELPLVLRVPVHMLCTFYVFCGLGYGYIGMTYLQSSSIFLVGRSSDKHGFTHTS